MKFTLTNPDGSKSLEECEVLRMVRKNVLQVELLLCVKRTGQCLYLTEELVAIVI